MSICSLCLLFCENPHAISFLVSHDFSIYCMIALWNSLQVSILCPDIILLELIFPFFLVARRFYINDVTTFIILFFILNYHHLFFGISLILLCLEVIVRDLCYKSNAFVWLETFHKEYSYWKILMHKYIIMQLLLSNTTFIHISRKLSRCLPSLLG